jgi:uncharacterized integral membrane protein
VSEPGQEERGQEQEQEQPRQEEESRRARALRYGHRTKLYASIVLAISSLVFLILLIARNADAVDFDYVFGTTHTRLIWLIVISAITGWVLGIVTSFLIRRRTRWRRAE